MKHGDLLPPLRLLTFSVSNVARMYPEVKVGAEKCLPVGHHPRDAGRFKGGADGGYGAGLQSFAALKAHDRVR